MAYRYNHHTTLSLGKTIDAFSSPAAFTALPNTIKAKHQEESFLVRLRLISQCPVIGDGGVFINSNPFVCDEQPRAKTTAFAVLGIWRKDILYIHLSDHLVMTAQRCHTYHSHKDVEEIQAGRPGDSFLVT